MSVQSRRLTKKQFAIHIMESVMNSLRESCHMVPGATPEFIRLYKESLRIAGNGLRPAVVLDARYTEIIPDEEKSDGTPD